MQGDKISNGKVIEHPLAYKCPVNDFLSTKPLHGSLELYMCENDEAPEYVNGPGISTVGLN